MTRAPWKPWTPADDEAVRALYPAAARDVVLAALPGRTWMATSVRARLLGVRRVAYSGRKVWTPADDEALRAMWPEHVRKTICANLGRSWAAVVHRAKVLGLVADGVRWKGYLTVTKAARRTGYAPRTFLRILGAYREHFAAIGANEAAVAGIPAPSLTARNRPWLKHAHRMVDAQAALDAVEWWMAMEGAPQAAARLGLPYTTLVRRMEMAGVKVEKNGRRPAAWWNDFIAANPPSRALPARRGRRADRPGTVRALPAASQRKAVGQ